MFSKQSLLLFSLSFVHLIGIKLFTGGFLLARQSLSQFSDCSTQPCTIPPTHKRAVILVIDALRFDIVTSDPPSPPSPFHHNILTFPREITTKNPHNSFLYNAYADPPTTTLQRIKGIATGSLPTFSDAGNNLGGSSIAEDSILKQLRLSGKKIAFMGDNTWMSVFPEEFTPNVTFPYDSLNVEDLHTVDKGVIAHLFPLLGDKSKPFDLLIGHFLGMDHVGHRIGPDHPRMKAKLEQMNEVLRRVVQLLDDETLLVVLGDHGMDNLGNHCGDTVLETSSALWIYSKGPPLMQTSTPIPSGLLEYEIFPGTTVPHRHIQQIDLVPTISLILGLPIPFNNLGSIIPETFWRGHNGEHLAQALDINGAQVKRYLNAYRSSPAGHELDHVWDVLQSSWVNAQSSSATSHSGLVQRFNYNRVALAACRKIWAQFNLVSMGFGLGLLGLGVGSAWSAYSGIANAKDGWEGWLSSQHTVSLCGGVVGAVVGIVARYILGIGNISWALLFIPFTFCVTFIIRSPPRITLDAFKLTPYLLMLHSATFSSPSLAVWEDRLVVFLLFACVIPHVFTGLTVQSSPLRSRILGFSLLFAVCVKLMSVSTVCREEQQPSCHVTFFGTSTSPPITALILAVPVAFALPLAILRFLKISGSDAGLTRPFLPLILTPSLVGGAGYWIMEWADSASVLGDEWCPTLRLARTWLARSAFTLAFIIGSALWWLSPLCLDVKVVNDPKPRRVTVVGLPNAYGSSYLLFLMISFALLYLTIQLAGQLVLALAAVAVLAYLELLDSVREAKAKATKFVLTTSLTTNNPPAIPYQSLPLQFSNTLVFPLLGILAFYGTGHQPTISSLQLKSAFLLHPTVVYPFSRITLVINSLGSFFVMAMAAPLVAIWGHAPTSQSSAPTRRYLVRNITLAALGVIIYYSTLLFGIAVGATMLRHHPLVWKILAPRYVAGAVEMIVVDVALLIGVGAGGVVFKSHE
ncbi:alkaline-phosphatase-like protein [Flammula alnicola]|nr:alkaline-phosphatase-like protein [Flammula alnicola]